MSSRNQVLTNNTNSFPNNNSGQITPAVLRDFNADFINSTVFLDQTSSMSVASASQATSASYALTASFALNAGGGGTVDTGSLVTTSSFNAYTSSNNAKVNALEAATASYATSAITGSSIITASVNISTITFTKGNGTQFSITVAQSGSVATASLSLDSEKLGGVLPSGYVTTASFNPFSSSIAGRVSNLEAFSSSLDATYATDAQLNAATASLSASISSLSSSFLSTSSSLNNSVNSLISATSSYATKTELNAYTASENAFTASIKTFTGSIQTQVNALQAATSSYNTNTVFNAYTASTNTFTSSIQTQVNALQAATSSYVKNSQTSSMSVLSASFAATASFTPNAVTNVVVNVPTPNTIEVTFGNGSSTSYAINNVQSASFAATASYLLGSVISASYAATASSANNFIVRNALTASGLNYPTADGLAGQILETNGAGTLSFGDVETIFETVYTGESITKSDPLYVSGSQGANPIVYKADASNPNKMPVTFIASETIAAGNTTRGIVLGLIEGLNLTGYNAGQEVYVAPGGGWTSTRPTGSAAVQLLGVVTKGGAGGKGLVLNPGPVLLPNLTSGNVWIGNANGVPVAQATSSIKNVISASNATFAETIASGLNITASNLQVINNATVGGNLTVNGTASFAYVQTVTGSAVIIGQEYIVLNTQTPTSRYAGLKVIDSGSLNTTASIVWDSETNHWVYQTASGSSYSGGGFLAGPKNTGSLSDITYPTLNRILRSQGDDHIYDSNIIDDGTVKIQVNTQVTGALNVSAGITGSLLGTASFANSATSASYAATAQQATSASYWSGSITNVLSASYANNAQTAFSATSASFASTASYWSGSIINVLSASFANNANNALTASYWSGSIVNALSASFASTASYWSGSITNALSASYANNAQQATSASFATTASYWSGSISNVLSASYASNAQQATSASFATTASYAISGGVPGDEIYSYTFLLMGA